MTGPKPKKPGFRERFRRAFNGVSKKEAIDIAKDTLKDLKNPREIATFVIALATPGGFFAYGSYRVIKFRRQKKFPANDNREDDPAKKNPPPKPPKL